MHVLPSMALSRAACTACEQRKKMPGLRDVKGISLAARELSAASVDPNVNGTREINSPASVSYILIVGESFMSDVTHGECYDGLAS